MILQNPLKQPVPRKQMWKLIILIWTFKMAFGFEETKDLNIMGFFPMTGEVFRGGKACLLGSNMALQHINQRDDILHGYRLNLIWRDSKASIFEYSKTSVKQRLTKSLKVVFKTNYRLMQVIRGAFCNTFDLHQATIYH